MIEAESHLCYITFETRLVAHCDLESISHCSLDYISLWSKPYYDMI